MENYKQEFEIEKIITELMQEVIALKAANTTLKSMVQALFSQMPQSSYPQPFDMTYQKVYQGFLHELISSHSWYAGYWKHQLKGLQPDEL